MIVTEHVGPELEVVALCRDLFDRRSHHSSVQRNQSDALMGQNETTHALLKRTCN